MCKLWIKVGVWVLCARVGSLCNPHVTVFRKKVYLSSVQMAKCHMKSIWLNKRPCSCHLDVKFQSVFSNLSGDRDVMGGCWEDVGICKSTGYIQWKRKEKKWQIQSDIANLCFHIFFSHHSRRLKCQKHESPDGVITLKELFSKCLKQKTASPAPKQNMFKKKNSISGHIGISHPDSWKLLFWLFCLIFFSTSKCCKKSGWTWVTKWNNHHRNRRW